jgi:EpsI family protein
MEKINVRYMIVALLFLVFGVLCSYYGYGYGKTDHRKNLGNRLEQLPLQLGQWEGKWQPLEEQIYRILDTDTVLVNRYTNGNGSVFFTVVYYPEAKVEFHPPEACNTSRGDAVVNLGVREVKTNLQLIPTTVRVNVFSVIRANGNQDLYYYFFKTGDLSGDSYLNLRINMAMNRLLAKNRGAAMLVLSTPIVKGIDVSMQLLDRFLLDIHPEIIRYI